MAKFREILKDFLTSKGLEVDTKDSTKRMYQIAVENGFDVTTLENDVIVPIFVNSENFEQEEQEEQEHEEQEEQEQEEQEQEEQEQEEQEQEEQEQEEQEKKYQNDIKKAKKTAQKKTVKKTVENTIQNPIENPIQKSDNTWLWVILASVITGLIIYFKNSNNDKE